MKVIELEKSVLVTWKVWRLFVNLLPVDDKYSLVSRDNSWEISQMHLSQKENIFCELFSAFFKSILNFEDFQTKLTFRAYVFRKLVAPKEVLI